MTFWLLIAVLAYLLIGLILAILFFIVSATVQKEDGSFFFIIVVAWPLVLTGTIK